MKLSPLDGLFKATKLTASGRLQEATEAIQRALKMDVQDARPAQPRETGPVIDGVAEPLSRQQARQATGQLISGKFANAAGSRDYRLYLPSSYAGKAVPLIVMLHGCTQSPEDFAAGTRMNEAAEAGGFLVVYPAQTKAANASKCWNWFQGEEQHRDGGEPSLIAGITRQVMGQYAVDPHRVYVAGLSAGGAAAAIMGTGYPDLYAAIGVHSGLACGAASDMMSAFTAMHHGHAGAALPAGAAPVPAIVFHGDADGTVHLSNGDAVITQLMASSRLRAERGDGRAAGDHASAGRAYSRTRFIDEAGQVVLEQWVIHGAGHAWAGGSKAGSFTDPQGPDATAEMVRFFLEHPRR